MKERVKRAPENESPSDKFRRIAGYRLANALTDIGLIAKCFAAGYEYTPEQVDKIVNHLQSAISYVQESARGGKSKAKGIDL